jgi:hypothetical protein
MLVILSVEHNIMMEGGGIILEISQRLDVRGQGNAIAYWDHSGQEMTSLWCQFTYQEEYIDKFPNTYITAWIH